MGGYQVHGLGKREPRATRLAERLEDFDFDPFPFMSGFTDNRRRF